MPSILRAKTSDLVVAWYHWEDIELPEPGSPDHFDVTDSDAVLRYIRENGLAHSVTYGDAIGDDELTAYQIDGISQPEPTAAPSPLAVVNSIATDTSLSPSDALARIRKALNLPTS